MRCPHFEGGNEEGGINGIHHYSHTQRKIPVGCTAYNQDSNYSIEVIIWYFPHLLNNYEGSITCNARGYHIWRLMTPISANLIFPAPFEQLWRSVDKSGKGLSYMTFIDTNKHLYFGNSRTRSRELKYSYILQMSYMKFHSNSSLSHTPTSSASWACTLLSTHLLNAHYLSFVVTMGSGRLAGGLLEGQALSYSLGVP